MHLCQEHTCPSFYALEGSLSFFVPFEFLSFVAHPFFASATPCLRILLWTHGNNWRTLGSSYFVCPFWEPSMSTQPQLPPGSALNHACPPFRYIIESLRISHFDGLHFKPSIFFQSKTSSSRSMWSSKVGVAIITSST